MKQEFKFDRKSDLSVFSYDVSKSTFVDSLTDYIGPPNRVHNQV